MFTIRCPKCNRTNARRNLNCIICGHELSYRDSSLNDPYQNLPRIRHISWLNRILLVIIILIVLYIMHRSRMMNFSLW